MVISETYALFLTFTLDPPQQSQLFAYELLLVALVAAVILSAAMCNSQLKVLLFHVPCLTASNTWQVDCRTRVVIHRRP